MANQLFGGFLFTDAGVAINGATADLLDRNTTTPVRATTTTNASGYWAISHATEGRFDVRITNGSSVRWHKYDTESQITTLEVAQLRIRNPADTFDYDIAGGAIVADRILNLPVITGTDTLAVLALAQTFLTGVKTFNSSILAIRNPADTFSYTIAGGAIVADRILTLPLLTAGDTLSALGLAQTYSAIKTFSAIPVMSGGAVGFPATQVASAVANDLDDYEEGTFTPALTFGGAAVGMAFDDQRGYYTKVGNIVHVMLLLALNTVGSSTGAAVVTGLPFTAANLTGYNPTGSLYLDTVTFANYPQVLGAANATTIDLYEITNAGVVTTLTNADFAAATRVRISMSYRV